MNTNFHTLKHNIAKKTPGKFRKFPCQHWFQWNPLNFILVRCRDDGFLKSIQSVKFTGVSRDQVSFDSNGNGLGAYDITVVNMETEQWEPIGSWISNTSNVLDLPANMSFLDLNLKKLRMLWKKVYNNSIEPTSFCGQQCLPGHWMIPEERHQVSYYIS